MNNANRLTLWIVIAGSLMVGLFACSFDSLWIDEAWVAILASERDLSSWWHKMRDVSGSTLQMPLYTLYLWLWEKIAGHSEWALRAANIPFFVLGQWALFRSLRHDRKLAIWAAVIAAGSPFVWGYLAEARPYAMQIGGASLVVAGLIQLRRGQPFATRDLALFCAGLLILCGSSSLAFPWAGMALLTALFLVYRDRDLMRLRAGNVLLIIGTSLCLLLLFAYDSWATLNGAKASSVGKTGILNILFVGYELLGFAGLGPGRLQLRDSQSLSVFTPYLLSLLGLALALSLALFRLRRVERSLWTTFLLYSVLPLIFVTLLAWVAPFRLLGRHVTPLAPVVFVTLAYAASATMKWGANRWFIPLWFASALMLRFHPRHYRDDYRAAAQEARSALAKGETVWWSADTAAAQYYDLPVADFARAPGALLTVSLSPERHDRVPPPDVVIASKPDIFDGTNAIRAFVTEKGYVVVQRLPAFTIWRKAADPPADH